MIIMLFILACTQALFSQIKADAKKSDAIGKALSELVKSDKAPGMIAAIVSSEGVRAIGSSGVREAGSDVPITCNDHFHLGSCTKAMTAVMIATLLAEGKLDWETKLVEAIPELKKSIHPDYSDVTLWQLLTHRAGLPSNPVNWGAHPAKEIKARRLAILEDNLSSQSAIKKGEFNYSNFGYVIAACMAEKVTGQSWEILMKQRLFDPLGMSSAGEIHCSIKDWAKFFSLFMSGKNPVLDSTYINKLEEPVGFYAGGWGTIEDRPWANGKLLTHNGSNGIWYATVIVATKIDRAYIVATNSRDFSSTEEVCSQMINELITMDLGTK